MITMMMIREVYGREREREMEKEREGDNIYKLLHARAFHTRTYYSHVNAPVRGRDNERMHNATSLSE